jgi:hypothetical protein
MNYMNKVLSVIESRVSRSEVIPLWLLVSPIHPVADLRGGTIDLHPLDVDLRMFSVRELEYMKSYPGVQRRMDGGRRGSMVLFITRTDVLADGISRGPCFPSSHQGFSTIMRG